MLLKVCIKLFSVYILTFNAGKTAMAENEQHRIQPVTQADDTGMSSNVRELLQNIKKAQNLVNDTRINGGMAVEKIVPFQVSVQTYRRNTWRHYCGGSIISESHVLTAAHCVDKFKVEHIHIVAGTLTWNTGGQRHRAVAKSIHPAFALSPRIVNDIAVVKVKPAFNLRHSSIATISLGGASRIGGAVQVRLMGWGATTPTAAGGLSNQLQQLDYHTISNAECRRRGFRVTQNEICALSYKGQGSCMGDSGGPLVTTQGPLQLVGVVSYGSATCAQGRPDVYSRVSSFLAYITKAITSEIP